MHLVLVNSLGGLSLPRNSAVRLTDRPDMTVAVDIKQQNSIANEDLGFAFKDIILSAQSSETDISSKELPHVTLVIT